MSRILGVDLGSKRIGLAVADAGVGIARPLLTVNRGATLDDDAAAIGRAVPRAGRRRSSWSACRSRRAATRADGGRRARRGRRRRRSASALPVTMRDERLSSSEAERRLGPMPRGRSGGPPTRTQRDALPRANRSRGRERHPAGRARRATGGRVRARDRRHERSAAARGPRERRRDPPRPGSRRRRQTATSGPAGYGRGPGDQRSYERYGDPGGGLARLLKFLCSCVRARGRRARGAVTVARPLARLAVVGWPRTTRRRSGSAFVADLVREDLGDALTDAGPAPTDEIVFTVESGDTPPTLAPRLPRRA